MAVLILTLTGAAVGCAAEDPGDPGGGAASSGPVNGGSVASSGAADGIASPHVTDARAQLTALAAAAQDRTLTGFYALATAGRPDRSVAVTLSTDGGWRVDIPGGALGGTADVSIAQNADGLYQCALPSTQRPAGPSCVRLGDPDSRIDPALDPRVQHLFTDWRDVLSDRRAPLAVSVNEPLPGVPGTCFSVEPTTASLSSPIDAGIYCYLPDGTLTGARLALGTVVLTAAPGDAPASIDLPGSVAVGNPLRTASPPAPRAG